MSDSNTLDDLILNDPEPENSKSKGILILLGLVVLLIIVGAILAKMIFSSPDDVKQESNKDVKKEVNLSSNTKDNKKLQSMPEDADLAPLDDTAMPNADTVAIDDKEKDTKAEDKKENSDAMTITRAEPKDNIDTQADTEVKKVEEKAKPKPKPKPKIQNIVHHDKPKTKRLIGGHGNVYIQVGSFSKGPTESFINKIRRAGFRYRIKEVNGFRRVLVGPFASEAEANRYLGKIKAQISPSAFIKK